MAPTRFVSSRLGAVALVLFLLGVSLAFFRGRLETSDEVQMFLTSMSLAERGSFQWDREYQGRLFSGYGAGTPLAGIPAYWLNRALADALPESIDSLAPLTNAVLFALTGLLAALLLPGEKRWWAVAVIMSASPLLPASLSFYSEPLSAAGLLAIVVAMRRPGLWWLAALGAFAAVAARPAMVPFAGLILVWGWRESAPWRGLIAGGVGIGLGILSSLVQNALLRGNPFESGYQGQDFTTPIATGLYGLLVSPERGLLIFWPLVHLPALCWSALDPSERGLVKIAVASLLISLALHGLFWTWHGGWTAGPRFLLPTLALFIAPVAACWLRLSELTAPRRACFWLALGWSALMAFIYARHSPNTWWNTLWGFHQMENQWLFLPQLSLWQAWLQGAPLEPAAPTLSAGWRAGHLALCTVLTVGTLYPLLLPWRGFTGIDPEAAAEPVPAPRIDWTAAVAGPSPVLVVVVAIWGSAALSLLAGPRGWRDVDAPSSEPLPHLSVREAGRYEGWLDYPLDSPLMLRAKANALYRVYVNDQLVLEQMEPIPQHLPGVELPLTRGLHLIRVEVMEKEPGVAPLFQLFWNWPGGGTYLAPAGGDWVLPAPQQGISRAFTWLHRREALLAAVLIALLIVLKRRRAS